MRDYKLYLHDIREAAEKIETFTKGFTFEEFAKDTKTVDAVIRNLEIIGEAAKHVPKRVKRWITSEPILKRMGFCFSPLRLTPYASRLTLYVFCVDRSRPCQRLHLLKT